MLDADTALLSGDALELRGGGRSRRVPASRHQIRSIVGHHQGVHDAGRLAVPDRAHRSTRGGFAATGTNAARPPGGRVAAAGAAQSSCATPRGFPADGLLITSSTFATGSIPEVSASVSLRPGRSEAVPAEATGSGRADSAKTCPDLRGSP
jgi:hypothetical protein